MNLPGTLFLIDTSAAARITNPKIAEIITNLIDDGIAATCITTDLEAGFSANPPQRLAAIQMFRAQHMVTLPVTEAIADRARQIQRLLMERGLHRAAGSMDLLTAAIAEHHRAIVLHYDADFEHIAQITGQRQQWIAPRGTID